MTRRELLEMADPNSLSCQRERGAIYFGMSIESAIEELINRCTATAVPQKWRRDRINMYAMGLRSKFRQARFALEVLETLYDAEETVTSTGDDWLTQKEKIEFYTDCFWTFLYSAFEVFAQVVNQVMDLIADEKDVSFKFVVRKTESRNVGDKLTAQLKKIRKSRFYNTHL